MFLWETTENYPIIITKYHPYLFNCETIPILKVKKEKKKKKKRQKKNTLMSTESFILLNSFMDFLLFFL